MVIPLNNISNIRIWTYQSLILLIWYIITLLIHSVFFVISYWYAESPIKQTDIIAIFVDKNIQPEINTDLKRYSTTYIQQRYSDTKAVVLPIDITNIKAPDITKIIENIYFDGIQNTPSQLKGIILIWDIPLPVVRRQNSIFPSILPYVDMEWQQFLYNISTQYFERTNKEDSQPELRHWVINFDTRINEYKKFFAKLRTYEQSPETFISRNIWYDDLVYLRQNFNPTLIQNYLHQFIHAEDIWYHRFTDNMIQLFNNQEQEKNKKILTDIPWNNQWSINESGVNNTTLDEQIADALKQTPPTSSNTPTLLLGQTISNFIKTYSEIISPVYLSTIRDNSSAWWRRWSRMIDNHISKIELKDDLLTRWHNKTYNPLLVDINNKLEEAVNNAIKINKAYMNIPITTQYDKKVWEERCFLLSTKRKVSCDSFRPKQRKRVEGLKRFQTFFFGKNAESVKSLIDISIYRWTYQSEWYQVSWQLINNPLMTGTTTDPLTRSIWATRWINNRQTINHRWYNIFLSQQDESLRQQFRNTPFVANCPDHIKDDVRHFVQQFRWWVSPINLTQWPSGELVLWSHNLSAAREPYIMEGPIDNPISKPSGIGWSLFDPAWSKALLSPVAFPLDNKAINKIASVQKITELPIQNNLEENPTFSLPNICVSRESIPYNDIDIDSMLDKRAANKSKISIFVNKQRVKEENNCTDNKCLVSEIINIKTIDSRVLHNYPTPEYISGMNITTQDRAIDSIRHLTFLGIWWQTITIPMPNLYEIPVYQKNQQWIYELWDIEDINKQIRLYLRNTIISINTKLTQQNTLRGTRYTANKNMFDILWWVDSLATPLRTVSLLDESQLITLLWNDTIDIIARQLYTLNSPRPTKTTSQYLGEHITNLLDQATIDKKIEYTLQQYLTAGQDTNPLKTPGYNATGYEALFFIDDWEQSITPSSIPSFISKTIDNNSRFDQIATIQNTTNNQSFTQKDDIECKIEPDGWVRIEERPSAFWCWLRRTLKKPLALSINFNNAQGPVFMPGDWGTYISDSTINNNTPQQLQTYSSQREQSVEQQQESQRTFNSLPLAQQSSLQEIRDTVRISFLDRFFPLETVDNISTQQSIRINSLKKQPILNISITTTGDNCLRIGGTNTCQQPFIQLLELTTWTIQQIPFSFINNNIWDVFVNMSVCVSNEYCYQETENITIGPWIIHRTEIITPTDKIIPWVSLPIIIRWYDKFNNPLAQQTQSFALYTNQWSFSNGKQSISISTFDDAGTILNTDNKITDPTTITLMLLQTGRNVLNEALIPTTQKTIYLTPATVSIRHLNKTILSWDRLVYQLPAEHTWLSYTDRYWINNIKPSGLLSLNLSIVDNAWQTITTTASVRTTNNIMNPGRIVSQSTWLTWRTMPLEHLVFKPTNTYQLSTGSTSLISLYPTGKAWRETLIIDIPWLQSIPISIDILPSKPNRIDIQIPQKSITPPNKTTATITISDKRWNIINTPTNVKINTFGAISLSWWQQQADIIKQTWSSLSIPIETSIKWWIWYISAYLKEIPLSEQRIWYTSLLVKKQLLPTSWLNVLYATLGGQDRWNQRWYFSDHTSWGMDLISSSPKLLSITTLIIDPLSIKPLKTIVRSNLTIDTNQSQEITLQPNNNTTTISINDVWTLKLRQRSDITSLTARSKSWLDALVISRPMLVYIPTTTDSIIRSNTLQNDILSINGKIVRDIKQHIIAPWIIISYSGTYINNNQWSQRIIRYQWNPIWTIYIGKYNESFTTDQTTSIINYRTTKTFWEWSTNGLSAIWRYDPNSSLEINSQHPSIEKITDSSLFIWFRWGSKHLSYWSAGQSVWEATRSLGSAFSINKWDPLLVRSSITRPVPTTTHDSGLWTPIYTNPDKTIQKVLVWDINNDTLKDTIVIHTDGSVKLIKQSQNGHMNIVWDLMIIPGGIKEAYLWDTEGDWYADIILRTNNNQLKVYNNKRWVFGVDGTSICLDIPWWPTNLSTIEQLFIKDMDNDWTIDVITNDNQWAISIFYGWSSNEGPHYLSTSTNGCDNNRKKRQQSHKKIIKHVWVTLNSWSVIRDQSLIRWKWLQLPTTPNAVNNEGDLTNPLFNNFLNGWIPDISNLNTNQIVWDATTTMLKYIPSPTSELPKNETLSIEDIRYIPLDKLDTADQVVWYKTYSQLTWWLLFSWDSVRVTVTLQSDRQSVLSYIDHIQWPRVIELDNKNLPLSLTGLAPSYIIKPLDGSNDYQYMIDNISLNAWQRISRSYQLIYQWSSPYRIDINKYNADPYWDISLYSKDSCDKKLITLTNTATLPYRSYREETKDLSKTMDALLSGQQTNSNSGITDILSQLWWLNVSNPWSNNPPFLNTIKEQRSNNSILNWGTSTNPTNMINDFLQNNGRVEFNLNLWLANQTINNAENILDEALQWLCRWFSLNQKSCGWLPLPFNMAFLAPGNFNVMGCHIAKDPWLPIFHFPGTIFIPTPAWPIPTPFPRWLKWPWDSFIRPGWWTFPSNIRIYAAPTTTMQIGIAICLWPMVVGTKLPPLVRDLWWNCVVTAIPMPKCRWSTDGKSDGLWWDRINNDIKQLAIIGQCQNPLPSTSNTNIESNNQQQTPFVWVDVTKLWSNDLNDQSNSPAGENSYRRWTIAPGTYLWVIDFKRTAQRVNPDTGEIEWTTLRWGKNSNNRIGIGGAIAKTISKCLIQWRLDNQIKYIVNNLTNMTIALYLPDVSDLFQWFDTLNVSNFQQLMTQNRSQFQQSQENTWWFNPFQKDSYNNISNKISNPFDALSSLFNQVPLVHISTKDISVQIPSIYAEDITRYSSYLETRLLENVSKLKRRWWVINSTFNFCGIQGNLTDPQFMQSLKGYREQVNLESQRIKRQIDRNITGSKEQLELKTACLEFVSNQSITALITFQTQWEQAIKAVRQNIRILEEYKRFPLQLYEWIHITDRYLSELSSVISNTMGTLQQRLTINAARFEQYTNTIILMIWVIKTRQILIDVSVNWKSQCGTCKNDTYDSYSCSMSFLCPDIPVIRFPKFKIPNIYLDFSHIDIKMNIVLPKFNFVPVSIPLPRLPTLPSPPNIRLDTALPTTTTQQLGITPLKEISKLAIPWVSLPIIPVLPSPPRLPPLPSFIPTIKLDLPVLPPAPRIPNINVDIRSAINGIDKIGKIFCIIKWGIGLVGESTVKSKIEQLTQRTWDVPFFDQMLTQRPQPQPNVWFDYKIDAFVRLQYNFDAVTNLLQGLASQVNNRTNTTLIEPSQETINNISDTLNNNNTNQSIQDAGNQTINIQWSLPTQQPDISYKQWKSDLLDSLTLLTHKSPWWKEIQTINSIQKLVNTPINFQPNIYQIEETKTLLLSEITQKRTFLSSLDSQQWPNHIYNKLIAYSKEPQLVSDNIMSGTINTSLFIPDRHTQHILTSQENPLIAYLETNNTLAQWYLNALQKNSAETLRMSDITHQQSIDYMSNLTKRLQQTIWNTWRNELSIQDITTTHDKKSLWRQHCPIPGTWKNETSLYTWYNILLAQNNISLNDSTAKGYDLSKLLDMTSNLKGIRIDGWSWEQINIVQSSYNIEQIQNNYFLSDINDDKKEDIIMRDTTTVYLKQAITTGNTNRWASLSEWWTKDSIYYLTAPIISSQQLNTIRDNNNGYITTNWLSIRIRSTNTSVKERIMQWQTYETLSVSRANASQQNTQSDGYIISYVQRSDLNQDRMAHTTILPTEYKAEHYIIILPQGTSLTGKTITIPWRFDNQLITNLMTGIITQASFIDPTEIQHTIRLTDVSRNRHYLRIMTLWRDNDSYRIISPWSNQIVWWLQKDADNRWPLPTIELLRPSTQETISRGINLKGLINTNYTIRVKREDKSWISWHRVKWWSGEQRMYSGDTLLLSWLMYTGKQTIPLTIWASDILDNKTIQPLTLTITTPGLSISAINKISPTLRSIISTLSKDLDTGFIAYQKQQQSNQWITLTGKQQTTLTDRYALAPRQLMITGGFFDIGSLIGFWNPEGTKIGTLDPRNGEIIIPESFRDNTSIRVWFMSHFPMIQLRHNNPQIKQFEIYIPPRRLSTWAQAIEILNGSYTIQSLPSQWLMSYNNGFCISSDNQCIIAINTWWEISIPSPRHTTMNGTYSFDTTTQEIIYTIISTLSQQSIARIRIIADEMK